MTFIDRITKPQWANTVLFFCYLRMIGAGIHGYLYQSELVSGEEEEYVPLWHEGFYFIPAALYELIALLAVLKLTGDHSWARAQQFNFFMGFAAFNLIEETFLKPNEYDAMEYEGVLWAIVLISLTYIWKHLKKKKI